MNEIDSDLKETKLNGNGKTSNPICCFCKKPIQENRGIYWIKGTGGVYSRGVYPSKIYCVHWGQCSRPVGQYFAQLEPDEKGEFWFYGSLPFRINTDETANDNDRFIYVIKSDANYKIGIAKNPKKRMGDLQTGDPIEHAVVYTSFVENAEQLEQELHQHYSEYSVRGEWFNLPPANLEELLKILQDKGFVESIPPFDNIIYYPRETRVLWNDKAGTVHSLETKPYPHEVGYNIVLDEQESKDEPEIENASYCELRLEETGEMSIEGCEVSSVNESPPGDTERSVYTLQDILGSEEE